MPHNFPCDRAMKQASLVLAAATAGSLGVEAFTVPYTTVVADNTGDVPVIVGETAFLGGGDGLLAAPVKGTAAVKIWYEFIDPDTNARAMMTWSALEFRSLVNPQAVALVCFITLSSPPLIFCHSPLVRPLPLTFLQQHTQPILLVPFTISKGNTAHGLLSKHFLLPKVLIQAKTILALFSHLIVSTTRHSLLGVEIAPLLLEKDVVLSIFTNKIRAPKSTLGLKPLSSLTTSCTDLESQRSP
jgi:hypothetical protein